MTEAYTSELVAVRFAKDHICLEAVELVTSEDANHEVHTSPYFVARFSGKPDARLLQVMPDSITTRNAHCALRSQSNKRR